MLPKQIKPPVISHVGCFRISKPCFMAQRAGKIGNGKSETGTQAMKMPIPPSEFVIPPSHEPLLSHLGLAFPFSIHAIILALTIIVHRQ